MQAKDTTITTDVNTDNKSFFDSARFKLFNAISERNFNINPFYIKLTGSIASGYFLTQLIFLARRYNYGEFYKTDEYFMTKLCMTEKEVRNHKKNLIDRGYIFVIKTGYPATSHYKVNLQKIIEMAEKGSITTPPFDSSEPPENHSHDERASLEGKSTKTASVFGDSTDKRASKSRRKGVTDYINDLDNDNNNKVENLTNREGLLAPLVVVSEDLKKKLNEIGIANCYVENLVETYTEAKILEKLAFMPHKTKIRDSQAAWLRGALVGDYHPPKSCSSGKNGVPVEVERIYQARMRDADLQSIREWEAKHLASKEESESNLCATMINSLRTSFEQRWNDTAELP